MPVYCADFSFNKSDGSTGNFDARINADCIETAFAEAKIQVRSDPNRQYVDGLCGSVVHKDLAEVAVEFNPLRHSKSPYDCGDGDAYYSRLNEKPHKWVLGHKIEDLTVEERAEYYRGVEENPLGRKWF